MEFEPMQMSECNEESCKNTINFYSEKYDKYICYQCHTYRYFECDVEVVENVSNSELISFKLNHASNVLALLREATTNGIFGVQVQDYHAKIQQLEDIMKGVHESYTNCMQNGNFRFLNNIQIQAHKFVTRVKKSELFIEYMMMKYSRRFIEPEDQTQISSR